MFLKNSPQWFVMTSKKELAAVRSEIDKIDSNILELINRRASLAIKARGFKKKASLRVYDPTREQQIQEKLAKSNKGPLSTESVLFVFREIVSCCRSLQHENKVAYLGPEGSFSNQAAFRRFGEASEFLPVHSFRDVFEEVSAGRADFGIVPVENSEEGSVGDVLDMLLEWDLEISSECFERINHSLLAKTGDIEEIVTVASHPQALGQCRMWLTRNLHCVSLLETPSTAAAAKMAAEEQCMAAIASDFAGSIYGLKTVRNHIEDSVQNTTRFLVVGKKKSPPTGLDKTSIAFSVKDRPGALSHAIFLPFSEAGINLTKIESRPSRDTPWEYVFFVDFSGHREDEKIRKALKKVEEVSVFLKVLGSYPDGRKA